jgi:tRNA-specific 2-thiouridylase
MKHTIAVAISGGVDSMMAAHLLRQKGHEVIGVHFLTGFEISGQTMERTGEASAHQVQEIGRQLGIRIEICDLRREFKQQVIDYFVQSYYAGLTPNPCLKCNPTIKFGALMEFARKLGADLMATGHYARVKKDASGSFRLFKGIDISKDQSYFLSRLTQPQLSKACFPLGEMTKPDVKKLANDTGLQPTTLDESQDVCFIKNIAYSEFLTKQTGVTPTSGPIVDQSGKILGRHRGLHRYTVGQRRGINCPAPEPYYVLRIDTKNNRLVVGSKSELLASTCRAVDINWIDKRPTEPIEVLTRIRYRSKEVPSTVYPLDDQKADIRFETLQEAITPGQGAVFYRGDELLGGGFIRLDS